MQKQQIIRELYKPARINYKRRSIRISGIDDLWQIDLAEMPHHVQENNGRKYILVVINCFSKFCWVASLKTKTGAEVADALEKILAKNTVPRNINSDLGKEFYNHHFKKLMDKYGINHYSTFSIKKAAICERLIRTLKSKIYKLLALHGTHKWINKLDEVVSSYNNSRHRTIGMKPKDVNKTNELEILHRVYIPKNMNIDHHKKYKLGDIVRISKQKHVFEKGYTASFTTELFKIVQVLHTYPVTYLLEDLDGRPIRGCFYREELQVTKVPDVYLIEKILQRRGDKVKVSWLGFPNPTWIKSSDLV